ncbi:MAG TPA: RDD family protein [Thermoanaerobaculia bacterium]|nr:RDD family protein [Thermoanaerobaculia bacterium]
MEMALTCRNHPDAVEGLRYCSRCGQAFCPDCLVALRGNVFCATCKVEQLRDLTSGVDQSALELAGIGRRFGALLIDWLILNVPIMVAVFATMAVAVSNKNFDPIWLQPGILVVVAIYVTYEGLMLAARGQTLGKMAMRIKVVRADGTPITTGQAWGRAFMRRILAWCLSIFNYLPAFFTKDRTCLHDLVANTRVVNWS